MSMTNNRKLQSEIERLLKKVVEGCQEFDSILAKVYAASSSNQKEKYEADLKKEIKKLQRSRDQIKTWIASNEIKQKSVLLEARKQIESKMEQFKSCERDSKTKAFSKEGLSQPVNDTDGKKETRQWIRKCLQELQNQIDQFESELEQSNFKKNTAKKTPRQEALERQVDRHKFHTTKLERVLRALENDRVTVEKVNELKDSVDYYTESNQDPEFMEDEEMYEILGIPLDEEEKPNLLVSSSDSQETNSDDEGADNLSQDSTSSTSSATSTVSTTSTTSVSSTTPAAVPSKNLLSMSANAIQNVPPKAAAPAPATIPTTPTVQILKPQPQPTTPVPPTTTPPPGLAQKAQPPEARTKGPSPTQPQAQIVQPQPQPQAPTASKLAPRPSGPAPAPIPAQPQGPTMAQTLAARHQEELARTATPPQNYSKIVQQLASTQQHNMHFPPLGREAAQPPSQPQAQAQPQAQPQFQPQPVSQLSQLSQLQPQTQPQQSQLPIVQQPPIQQPPIQQPPAQQAQMQPPIQQPPIQQPPIQQPVQQQTDYKFLQQQFNAMGLDDGMNDLDDSKNNETFDNSNPTEPGTLADIATSTLEKLNAVNSGAIAEQEHITAMTMLESSMKNIPESMDSERPKQYTPRNPYPVPSSYPQMPLPIFENPAIFEKFDTDTLFFIFYYQQGTYQQYLAAKELKKQSWRYHKKYLTWFQRHEEPKEITNDYEQGTYVYFDYETGWCQRKKTEFTFEYRYLEDYD